MQIPILVQSDAFLFLLPIDSVLRDIVTGGWVDGLRLALQGYPALDFANGHHLQKSTTHPSMKKAWIFTIYSAHPKKAAWKPSIDGGYTLQNFQAEQTDVWILLGNFSRILFISMEVKVSMGSPAKETSVPVVISIQGILNVYETYFFRGYNYIDRLHDIFSVNFLRGARGSS